MFEGAVAEKKEPTIPVKYKVFIRTEYATIEQCFPEKSQALDFLNNSFKDRKVIAYEIKTISQ